MNALFWIWFFSPFGLLLALCIIRAMFRIIRYGFRQGMQDARNGVRYTWRDLRNMP